jgi:hypothetical protein
MANTIITNNQSRCIIYGFQLTAKESKEFDYIDAEELDMHSFFRYRGNVYDLSEAMRTSKDLELLGWNGVYTDSYFSGTVIKLDDDCETLVCGRIYS